jgi:hypothetical protein
LHSGTLYRHALPRFGAKKNIQIANYLKAERKNLPHITGN